MKVYLLAKHVIGDREWPPKSVLELPPGVTPTPLMQGLDDEAKSAILAVKRRIFGRNIGTPWMPKLLDDPPIEYVMDNPPVPPLPNTKDGPPR